MHHLSPWVAGLLRVGFGVAGADIIAKNMDLSKKEVYLDPLVPGKRVLAIFGFCDIHRFNFIVRSLGAKVREQSPFLPSGPLRHSPKWRSFCVMAGYDVCK